MAILKIKDSQGNFIEVPAIKGDKGDAGSYTTITETEDTTKINRGNASISVGRYGQAANPQVFVEAHNGSSFMYNGSEVATKNDLYNKQDLLTAGDNITIEDNVISANVKSYDSIEEFNGRTSIDNDDVYISTKNETLIEASENSFAMQPNVSAIDVTTNKVLMYSRDDENNCTDIELNPRGVFINEKEVATKDIVDDENIKLDTTWSSQKIADKINDIELAKFPNVTIYGQPTINQGQISNFNTTNYCQFPFVVDFKGQPFTLDFEFTTGNEVSNQHNIFDSEFGLAFAVRNSKFVVAISTNGTSWNIGESIGTHTISTNTTYRVRMNWDLANFTLAYSTDGGANYITDITRALTLQPFPKQMFIGITSDKSTFFNGIINLNYATLTIANKVVWQGMDDVGLSTRMAVNMSNIDEEGVNRVKSIINDVGYITNEALVPINEEVGKLSESIAVITDDVYYVITEENIGWEKGGVKDGSTSIPGELENSTTRIRTTFIYKALKGSRVTANNGYKFEVVAYRYAKPSSWDIASNPVIEASEIWQTEWTANQDCYVIVKVGRADDTAAEPSEGKNAVAIEFRQSVKADYLEWKDFTGKVRNGYYVNPNNGEITPSAAYHVTDMVAVTPNETVLLTGCMGGTTVGFAGYDKDMKFVCPLLSYQTLSGMTSGNTRSTVIDYPIVIPNNVYYIVGSSTTDNQYLNGISVSIKRKFKTLLDLKKYDHNLIALSRSNSLASGGTYANPVVDKKDFVFSVLTDVHGDVEATNAWIKYSSDNKDMIDACMNLGDLVAKKIDDDYRFFTDAVGKSEIPVYGVVGNHDIGDPFNGVSGGSINLNTAFNRYIKPLVDKGWVNSDKCYYYKDVAKYKLRLIFLNQYEADRNSGSDVAWWMYSSYYSETQLQWFADTLHSTPNGYTVIVFGHQIPSAKDNIIVEEGLFTMSQVFGRSFDVQRMILHGSPIEDIINAYKHSSTIDKTYTSDTVNLPSVHVSKDFSNALSNSFACFVCGHSHFHAITTHKTYTDQMYVTCPSSSKDIYQRSYGDIRPTEDEVPITVVGIDTEHKLVKLFNVGNKVTDDMRERNFIALAYD